MLCFERDTETEVPSYKFRGNLMKTPFTKRRFESAADKGPASVLYFVTNYSFISWTKNKKKYKNTLEVKGKELFHMYLF